MTSAPPRRRICATPYNLMAEPCRRLAPNARARAAGYRQQSACRIRVIPNPIDRNPWPCSRRGWDQHAACTPRDLLVTSSTRIGNGGSGRSVLAPGSTSQAEARPSEHRANAGRSTASASRGCDGHPALRPSWHSVIPHNRNSAMVSDNGFCPMISDDHGRAMITHDGGRTMVADHEAAAIVAAVTSRRSFVCGNKSQTRG
jgi:hypothetical protein